MLGSLREDDVECIKLRADFKTAKAYGKFVRERINKGMLVRCCESVQSIDLCFRQTGTVVAVNHGFDINIQVISNCFRD